MAYTVDKTIGGVNYKAQFTGLSHKYKMNAKSKVAVSGLVDVDEEKMVSFLLTEVIVDPPGLTIDSFEDADTLDEVIKFAADVMNGRFRNEKDKK